MGDLDSVVKVVSGLGVTGVLLLLVYGLLKGWFVTGREHGNLVAQQGILTGLYAGVQADMTAMRGELKALRDRDTSQQDEINDLHRQLTNEQRLKMEALAQLNEAQRTIAGLQSRVSDLEKQVGPRTLASNNSA